MRPALLAVVMLLAAPAAASAQISETLSIPTADGDRIHVEIQRAGDARARPGDPHVLAVQRARRGHAAEPGQRRRSAQRYVPRGYARAVADVLGTRNSSGCWDYGGRAGDAVRRRPRQRARAAAVVQRQGRDDRRLLRRHDREHGRERAAPRGASPRSSPRPRSAAGTATPTATASATLGNSQHPTDEGFDTPLAFDFGFGRTPPTQVTPQLVDALAEPRQPVRRPPSTPRAATTRSPDYDEFWHERDYRGADYDVPALIVHGWQDFNVRQSEGIDLFAALGRRPLKLVPVPGRARARRARELPAAARHVLRAHAQGRRNGVEDTAPVLTEGTDGVFRERAELAAARHEDAHDRAARPTEWTETGANTEEHGRAVPRHGAADAPTSRIAGAPVLRATVSRRRRPRPSDADARRHRARRHDHADHARLPQPPLPQRPGARGAGAGEHAGRPRRSRSHRRTRSSAPATASG